MLFPVVGVANKRHRSGREIEGKYHVKCFFLLLSKKKKTLFFTWRAVGVSVGGRGLSIYA